MRYRYARATSPLEPAIENRMPRAARSSRSILVAFTRLSDLKLRWGEAFAPQIRGGPDRTGVVLGRDHPNWLETDPVEQLLERPHLGAIRLHQLQSAHCRSAFGLQIDQLQARH